MTFLKHKPHLISLKQTLWKCFCVFLKIDRTYSVKGEPPSLFLCLVPPSFSRQFPHSNGNLRRLAGEAQTVNPCPPARVTSAKRCWEGRTAEVHLDGYPRKKGTAQVRARIALLNSSIASSAPRNVSRGRTRIHKHFL